MKPWFESLAGIRGLEEPERPEVGGLLQDLQGVEVVVGTADSICVVMVEGAGGQPQPLLWPMTLHLHGNDCGRA